MSAAAIEAPLIDAPSPVQSEVAAGPSFEDVVMSLPVELREDFVLASLYASLAESGITAHDVRSLEGNIRRVAHDRAIEIEAAGAQERHQARMAGVAQFSAGFVDTLGLLEHADDTLTALLRPESADQEHQPDSRRAADPALVRATTPSASSESAIAETSLTGLETMRDKIVTTVLGTVVTPYQRVTTRGLAENRVANARDTAEQPAVESNALQAITMEDVPTFVARVLTSKQIAQIRAGKVKSVYSILSKHQNNKMTRQNKREVRADNRREERTERLRNGVRAAQEAKRRRASKPVGVSAVDAYRVGRPF